MNLKQGTRLQGGRYIVGEVLGQGGFGITYSGVQTTLDARVAIKEFFMKECHNRDEETSQVSVAAVGSRELVERFREKFMKEARNIFRLKHKHIVSVIDVFEENGTAYYVMEFCGGGSLAGKVRDGALSELQAVRYIRQVASALAFVHGKNMMHLDVKPANILLDDEDNVVLIDFGLAKQYDDAGSQTSTTPVGISHGYAPMEQYKKGGVSSFSPATDIYSLGATLYKLVTGQTPPEANDVYDDGLPQLPSHLSVPVCRAIEAAMQPRRKERPQSIEEFLKILDSGDTVATAAADDGETVVPVEEETQIVEEVAGVKEYIAKGVTFKMIKVDGGTFRMGSTSGSRDEKPVHSVTLSPYYIGETEVTQELWTAVMGSNPSRFTSESQLPVECVSWNDCQEFIKKLNALTGGNFRLPTEAEWEFAARGGNESRGYEYSGSNDIDDVAWYWDNSGGRTHVVKGKQPNELGIYDMSGNVREWCSDWYGDYSSASVTDPKGPSSGSFRVNRGGSWNSGSSNCRCAYRSFNAPDVVIDFLGFRLASW